MSIFGVDAAGRGITQDGPEGANAVLPTDFLSFAIRAARIADRHFEDPGAALGELDRKLGFHVESGTFERNALQQVGASHFVAGFHIREIEVGNHVAQECEELVAESVTEEKGALVAARHEARTEHRVRVLVKKQLDHLQEIPGMIFEVRVMDDDELGIHVREPGADRRALSLVLFVTQPCPLKFADRSFRFQGPAKSGDCFRRAIGRGVVHDDHMHRFRRGDCSRILSLSRLDSTRYCSLYAGTITERLVLIRFRSESSMGEAPPVTRRSRDVFSTRPAASFDKCLTVSSVIPESILLEIYTEFTGGPSQKSNPAGRVVAAGSASPKEAATKRDEIFST